VGRKFGFGIVVEMDHGGGVRTRYAHLTAAMVHVGDDVAKGTFIATVGSTGITTGPHLHFEVLVNGRQVDPLRYRLPQPIPTEGAVSTAPTTPEEQAAATPASGGGAAPATGSHETQSTAQASPGPR
jgi:murein DD-endopeptidase MepM/ murein hydrolase activator NlpD